jgi:hypothetical protein
MKKTLFFVLSFIVGLGVAFAIKGYREPNPLSLNRETTEENIRISGPNDLPAELKKKSGNKTKIEPGNNKAKKIPIKKQVVSLLLLIGILSIMSTAKGFEFYPPIYVQKNTNQYRLGIDFMDEDKIFRVCVLNESESGYFRFETEKEEMSCYKVDIFMIPVGQNFEDTSSIIDYLPKITTLTKDACYTRLNPGKYYAVLRKISRTEEYNPVYAVLTSVVALKGSD